MSTYTTTSGNYATVSAICKPRFKSVVTLFAIVSMVLTLTPVIRPAGVDAWENALRIYNLAGFSPIGIVYIMTPLLLLHVYRQAMSFEGKLLRFFLIFIAGVASYGFCLRETFVWLLETTGEMPTIESSGMFIFVVWCFQMVMVIGDTWRVHAYHKAQRYAYQG